MNIDRGEDVTVGTEVNFRLTNVRAEAEDHVYNVGPQLQGPGPWWMCTITPIVIYCSSCGGRRVEGYFKSSAHSLELALALATSKLEEFRRVNGQMNRVHVEPTAPDDGR